MQLSDTVKTAGLVCAIAVSALAVLGGAAGGESDWSEAGLWAGWALLAVAAGVTTAAWRVPSRRQTLLILAAVIVGLALVVAFGILAAGESPDS